jgi:hypothetical protein
MTLPASPTDHFDGRRFFNPGGTRIPPIWKVPRMLMSERSAWPTHVPVQPQRPPQPAGDDDIVITFIGHSTFLIQTSAGNIITDPVSSSARVRTVHRSAACASRRAVR